MEQDLDGKVLLRSSETAGSRSPERVAGFDAFSDLAFAAKAMFPLARHAMLTINKRKRKPRLRQTARTARPASNRIRVVLLSARQLDFIEAATPDRSITQNLKYHYHCCRIVDTGQTSLLLRLSTAYFVNSIRCAWFPPVSGKLSPR